MPLAHASLSLLKKSAYAAGLFFLAHTAAAACSVTASGINFGVINPIAGAGASATGSITVNCPTATAFSVALSPGSGTFSQRFMQSSGNIFKYNIFLDSAYTLVWGDGTSSTSTWSGQADPSGVSHVIFARAPFQPVVVPGTYADTITVTVTY